MLMLLVRANVSSALDVSLSNRWKMGLRPSFEKKLIVRLYAEMYSKWCRLRIGSTCTYPSMTETIMYCIPENEVTGNFPVRSECIVSVNANTCVYVLLLIDVSGTDCTLSIESSVISVNNETNRFVEFCPCLT